MANDIEQTIATSVSAAAEQYEEMTGGWWLSHAPESFLQMQIVEGLRKRDYGIFVDATYNKIRSELGVLKGAPPKTGRARPDICVWFKSSSSVKAFIEIKKANSLAPVLADCRKIEGFMKHTTRPKYGYVVAYSEAKGASAQLTLENRFDRWAKDTGWDIATHDVCKTADKQQYMWGYVVLKKA